MRIVNFLLASMFLFFAFLQVNDPDPIVWILVYGIMAVVCVMAAFSFYPRKFIVAVAITYSIYALYYIPAVQEWLRQEDKMALFDDLAKMEYPYIEETREFLGLMICLVVLIGQLFHSRLKT